ncbi:Uncharacterized protein DBV15_12397 [Temnothorax longispinosus]|uniref:Uncharacterized protein n=1 Tax=Temnothorax longispinosus TaxID=300112 RepID=A0A4S2JM15_9HYME|nr:Uncharacterized protein DBV15_12397 [Temnothorax longispinosus]
MPHRMADFSPFFALGEGREISVRSYCGRLDSGKKAQICAITSDTQSIHHSCHCSSFRGDETAIHSTRRIQRARFAVEHVENLTDGTPVKLTANNLYRSIKGESNRLSLVGIPRGKRYMKILTVKLNKLFLG